MKPAFIFHQYVWLVNTLLRRGHMSLSDLDEQWRADEVAGGNPLSRTTFNRHRDAILDMFGLIIDCEKTAPYRYYISNPEELDANKVERWMLSTLTVGGMLGGSAALHDRILLEDVPAGESLLETIMRAMRHNRCLEIEYQRFGCEPHHVTLAPFAVKLYQRRWYVVGDNGEKIATYSLDRVQSLEVGSDEFTMPADFDARAFFADYSGIIADGTPLEHVVARVYGWAVNYLRTLPLHHSQRIIATGDGYADFAFDVRPTLDFIDELLRHDANVEVLEPQSLRTIVADRYRTALSRYN